MTQFPRLHNNGTSYDDLMGPLSEAIDALLDAEKALRLCSPHGRDYYLINDRAIDVAVEDHWLRMQGLAKTIAELTAIRQNLADQQDERDARRR